MKLLSVPGKVGIRKIKKHASEFEREEKEKKATGDIKKSCDSCEILEE